MNVVLIGYRCTGKTTVGLRLAGRLRIPFFDTDWLIEARAGKTIVDIVGGKGWDFFRALEKEIIRELSTMPVCVIATGGGAVMDRENVETMKRTGVLIWLAADEKTINERMEADPASGKQRPSLTGTDATGETARLLKEREPIYRAAAGLSIDTSGKDIDGVIDEICAFLHKNTIRE